MIVVVVMMMMMMVLEQCQRLHEACWGFNSHTIQADEVSNHHCDVSFTVTISTGRNLNYKLPEEITTIL